MLAAKSSWFLYKPTDEVLDGLAHPTGQFGWNSLNPTGWYSSSTSTPTTSCALLETAVKVGFGHLLSKRAMFIFSGTKKFAPLRSPMIPRQAMACQPVTASGQQDLGISWAHDGFHYPWLLSLAQLRIPSWLRMLRIGPCCSSSTAPGGLCKPEDMRQHRGATIA